MTVDEIAAIKARADAASPGPWTFCGAQRNEPCRCGYVFSNNGECYVARMVDPDEADPGCTLEYRRNNVRFIAHARKDVPALCATALAALQDVEDACEVLRELFEAYEDGTDQCTCENSGWVTPAPCTSCKARAILARLRAKQEEQSNGI